MLHLLLSNGAEPNAKDERGVTALILVAYSGNGNVARVLLDWGADPKAKGSHSMTSMHAAAQCRRVDVLHQLASHNADVNAKDINGKTAIYYAAENGHEDAVQQLLDLQADISSTDKCGRTVLHYAIVDSESWSGRNDSVVRLLVDANADLVNMEDSEGKASLQLVVDNGSREAVLLLLELGADNRGKGKQE